MFSALVSFAFVSHALAYSLPALTGPSSVGTIALEFIDYTRIDPFVPGVEPRDLMISVFYPVTHSHAYSLAKDFTPLFAEFADANNGLTPGTAENFTSNAYAGAKLNANTGSQPNVLIFSPGFGGSRVEYNAKMSDLASLGYIVIGIDSTHEAQFIDYPDNRTALGTVDYTATITQQMIDVRVQDMQYILNVLSSSDAYAKQIPGVHGKLDLSKVGVFGHSLGGSTAASAIEADSRFACGVNLDGSFFGNVIDSTISKPFMIMASDGHNRTSDPTWAAMWANLKGFKLEVSLTGSTHVAYTDYAALYDILKGTGEAPDAGDTFGTIGGARILTIESAYIGAFFGQCFSGKRDELLKGPSKAYPEVVFSRR